MKTNVTTVNFTDPTSSKYAVDKEETNDGSYGADSGMSTIGVQTKANRADAV